MTEEDDDDIVAALRRGEDGWEYAAADEIEGLRAEIAELRELLTECMQFSSDIAGFDMEAALAAIGERK